MKLFHSCGVLMTWDDLAARMTMLLFTAVGVMHHFSPCRELESGFQSFDAFAQPLDMYINHLDVEMQCAAMYPSPAISMSY